MGLISNRVDKTSLKPGDHIYSWRAVRTYAHHGIYVGDDKVIHFTRWGQEVGTGTAFDRLLTSSVPVPAQITCSTCTPPEEGHHGVISSCLNCFLAGGGLYRFEYGVPRALFLADVRGGTCTLAASDPDDIVVHRANHLLNYGFGCYNVFSNNCEDFAIYCKTELVALDQRAMAQSGQAVALVSGLTTAVMSTSLSLLTGAKAYEIARRAVKSYCDARIAGDIGMRKDVAKVSVEDLTKRLAAGKGKTMRQAHQGDGATPSGTQGDNDTTGDTLLWNFMAMQPPEFHGGADVSEAENWLLSVEKHLRTIGCSDEQRVQLGTSLLHGDGKHWWDTICQRYTDRRMTWVDFEAAFRETYIPVSVREQKVYEFIQLIQGTRTVAQYEAEFISLSRYAPELVASEWGKVKKFQQGLNPNIRQVLAGARIEEYATVVQRAHAIEKDLRDLRTGQVAVSGNDKCGQKGTREASASRTTERLSSCRGCGRRHQGQCQSRQPVCFVCGQSGYLRFNCPRIGETTATREITCFRCGQRGHMASSCTQPPQFGKQRSGGQGQRSG